jgi:diguanylate cyclase (GGDEF)-like protein
MEQRLRELLPFLLAGVAAFAALPLGETETASGHIEVAVAAALLAATAAGLFAPWERLPRLLGAVPVLAAFAGISLLRQAEGGAISGYSPLVLLPVFWLALHGARREVIASIGLVAAVFVVPILADPADYPSAEWRRALLWLVVTPTIGLTTQRLVARVRESARVDALTSLPNRRAWDERLPLAIAEAERGGRPLSVAIFDLDGFKAYNDAHGHPAGDRLLIECSELWRREVRSVDLLARLGGDEFGLVLPGSPLHAAEAVVDRAAAATPHLRLSVGVAEWRRGEDVQSLVARADADLYANKGVRRRR